MAGMLTAHGRSCRCRSHYPRGESMSSFWLFQTLEEDRRRPAVIRGDEAWSTGDLLDRIRACAARLRPVATEEVIAILAERSVEQIIAFCGVMAAGGCALLLDPDLPVERLGEVLRLSQAGRVIVGRDLLVKLPPGSCDATALEGLCASAAGAGKDPAPPPPDQAAYVIYTSGSTGTPKGCVLTHRTVEAYVHGDIALLGIRREDRILYRTPVSFDMAAEEILIGLVGGAPVVVATRGVHRDLPRLSAYMADQGTTVALFVPSLLDQFAALGGLAANPQLRVLGLGGEPVSRALVRRVREHLPTVVICNQYAPAECGATVIGHRLEDNFAAEVVPIGRPFPGSRAYVLRPDFTPAAELEEGDLFIAGSQIGRGYLHAPGLTAAGFLCDPFGDPGARMYATRDRAYRRADGVLVYRGRADQQVKLQGVRIELEEIEAALLGMVGVRAACAVVREEEAVPYLAAFVAAVDLDEHAALAYLRRLLPLAMVPRRVVALTELPRGHTEKIDRRALRHIRLPAPRTSANPAKAPTLPRGPLVDELRALFSQVLSLPNVRADDDFFMLGGDSLRAMILMAEVEARYLQAVSLTELLQRPTPATLAQSVLDLQRTLSPDLVSLWRQGEGPGTVICIHPLMGSVLIFYPLLRRLEGARSVVTIRAAGLAGGEDPHRTIPEMAAAYLAQLRSLKPRPPYHILAYSYGGVIGYELASMLQAAGAGPVRLHLLDASAAGAMRNEISPEARRWCGLDDGRVDVARLRSFVTMAFPALVWLPDSILVRLCRLGALQEAALDGYRPSRSPLDAVLYHLAGTSPSAYGWHALLPSIKCHALMDASHLNLLTPPAVDSLTALLRGELDREIRPDFPETDNTSVWSITNPNAAWWYSPS